MENKKLISLYVATKFCRKEEAKALYDKATERGWKISEDWTRHEKVEIKDVGVRITEQRAQDDLDGVMDANVFIMLADEPGPGMYVELGAAIAVSVMCKPLLILVVAPKELIFRSIFFYHPNVILLDSKRVEKNGIEYILDEVEEFHYAPRELKFRSIF